MYIPTKHQLDRAHKIYLHNEPRDLFYSVATELISLALENQTRLSLAEAVLVLLQTWNRPFYKYRKLKYDQIAALGRKIQANLEKLRYFRGSKPLLAIPDEQVQVSNIFEDFETVLGPVGAAKTLHLFAPNFFPLWDRSIAQKGYSICFGKLGTNGLNYVKFARDVYAQLDQIKEYVNANALKRLDEFNYCKYTKGWL